MRFRSFQKNVKFAGVSGALQGSFNAFQSNFLNSVGFRIVSGASWEIKRPSVASQASEEFRRSSGVGWVSRVSGRFQGISGRLPGASSTCDLFS